MIRKTVLVFMIFLVTGMMAQAQDGAQQFEGFNLVGYTEGGTKSWDVTGDTAEILGSLVQLTNIVANAYGEESMNLTARTGNIDRETGKMHLEQDVVITSQEGAQLRTDSLDWDREKDLVTTEDFVTITDKRLEATGTGIKAHPNLKLAQLNEDVTVKIKTELDRLDPQEPAPAAESKQTITITSDGPLEIDQNKQTAIFNDNVVAVQQDRVLNADRMEVYFDADERKIREIICTGNVKVTQGDNTSFSEKAVFKPQDQRIILTGRPKLILNTEGENGIASFGN
jgi:LPS export ABC transporter protein LptC/lipopolysaccharide transport protein LptA